MREQEALLRVENLSVRYSRDREALQNITISIDRNESLLITGPSGSGKTTFLRILLGLIPNLIKAQVKGLVRFLDHDPRKDMAYIAKNVVYIPQEPWDGITTPYVWSEIEYFANIEDIEEVLGIVRLGKHIKNRSTFTLSAGETQRLLIAIALGSKCRAILADEPLSYLDKQNVEVMLYLFKKLRSLGISLIVVDHGIEKWKGIVDKALLIDNGEIKYFGDTDHLLDIYRDSLSISFSKGKFMKKSVEKVIEVRDLSYRYPDSDRYVLTNLSFDIGKGELVLIKGASGRGKTTLLKILAGVLKPSKGYVRRYGKVLYIPDNPLLFFSEPTVREEVMGIDRIRGRELLEKLGLWDLKDRAIAKLSVGERKRVAIVSAIIRGADVILFDEPTVGLDPYNKIKVVDVVLKAMEKSNVAIVVATHDHVFDDIADRVIHLD